MGAKDDDETLQPTSTQSVIKDAVNTDFKDSDSWRPFQKTHHIRLKSNKPQPKPRAREGKRREKEILQKILYDNGNSLDEYQDFVAWVIQNHRQLLTIPDDNGRTPLDLAITETNNEFIWLTLRHSTKIEDLLSFDFSGQNCLQNAISERSPFASVMISKLRKEVSLDSPNNKNLFLAKSASKTRSGMTALHIAAECDIKDDDDVAEEPYKFKPWTKDTKASDAAEGSSQKMPPPTRKADSRPSWMQSDTKREPGVTEADRDKKRVKDQENVSSSRRDIESSPQITPELDKGHKFDTLSVVCALIEAHPDALCMTDEKGHTPFQTRLHAAARKEKISISGHEMSEEDRRDLFKKDEVLSYMRKYIIEHFDRTQAIDALYNDGPGELSEPLPHITVHSLLNFALGSSGQGPARLPTSYTARTISFDLFGLPYTSIDADFLEGLGKVLRFEGLLKYVVLPQFTFRNCKGLGDNQTDAKNDETIGMRRKGTRNQEDEGHGAQDMCDVFQWLRDCGVSSILVVKVRDDGEVAHSDEAIEKCMEGFGVRIWNWLKVDLSCDVILTTAKEVEDVALCSSGNNAVLLGWASPYGLVKLPNLKKVSVVIQKGLERKCRLEEYGRNFKEKIMKQRKDIEVIWTIQETELTVDAFFTDKDAMKSIDSTWMYTMANFGRFLSRTKNISQPNPKLKPVKIAIVDDGINPTLDIFTNCIRGGESFHPFSGSYGGRSGAFYVPYGPHGTMMAQLICKVCPMVELYIAQLEVFRGQHGQRSFRAESAAEAVKWAVKQGVDIISMSWYINEDESGNPLHNALKTADDDGIIMFCSSVDEGAAVVSQSLPGRFSQCIKIGASTDTGAKFSWVSADSDYLLPGDARQGKVGDEMRGGLQKAGSASPDAWWSHSTIDGHGHFGSSVSTALAAGLAGTLLYSERLGRAEYHGCLRRKFDDLGQKDYLREIVNMRSALTSLCLFPQDRDKFIHWSKFPEIDDKAWVLDVSSEEFKRIVVDFVNFIIPEKSNISR